LNSKTTVSSPQIFVDEMSLLRKRSCRLSDSLRTWAKVSGKGRCEPLPYLLTLPLLFKFWRRKKSLATDCTTSKTIIDEIDYFQRDKKRERGREGERRRGEEREKKKILLTLLTSLSVF
jgi:hypothetical protein